MKHGATCPLALVEVEAIFFEAACIDNSRPRTPRRPRRFSQVVDACPHEVACHVVIRADKLPEFFYVEISARSIPRPEILLCELREQTAVLASNAAHCWAFGADDAPCGKCFAVDAVILFGAIAPAVNVVIAHNVERGAKNTGRPLSEKRP